MGKFNISECSRVDFCDLFGTNTSFHDIAMHPDGTLFFVNNRNELFKVHLEDCNFEYIHTFNTIIPNRRIAGLIFDKKGILYAAGADLITYRIDTNEEINYGLFSDITCTGDLVFVGGRLIMSGSYNETAETGIFELNINEPDQTKLMFHTTNDTIRYTFPGLTGYELECNKYIIFGTGRNSWISPLQVLERGVFEIDFDSREVQLICDADLMQIMHGATHPLEFLGSETNCDLLLDLDRDNSSGEYPYDYRNRSIQCMTQKVSPICDEDVVIYTEDARVDSIRFTLEEVLNPGSEMLALAPDFTGATWVSTGTPDTPSYTLTLEGDRSDERYMEALREITYQHSDENATSGIRRVHVQAYNAVRTSEAYAYIHISSTPYSGRDTTFTLCQHIQYVNLSNIIGGQADGRWELPFASGEDIYFSEVDREELYRYITETEECGADTAEVRFHRVVDRMVDMGPDAQLCRGEMVEVSVPTQPGDVLLWSDGITTGDRLITDPGVYMLSITTVEGCELTGTLNVTARLEEKEESVQICSGSTYEYNGQFYTPGTTIADTLRPDTGCDTLLNIRVESLPIPELETDTMLCFNPELVIEGSTYQPGDTIYIWRSVEEGCDTLEKLYYRYHEYENLEWTIEKPVVCEGETTLVAVESQHPLTWSHGGEGNEQELPSGTYTVSHKDEEGCIQEETIIIAEADPVEYELEWMNPVCDQNNGRIEININNSGLQTEIFINEEPVQNGSMDDLGAGMYEIIITDDIGCTIDTQLMLLDTVQLEVVMPEVVHAIIQERVSIEYTASGPKITQVSFTPEEDIFWTGSSIEVTGRIPKQYTVRFESAEGCEAVANLLVEVSTPDEALVLPNVISKQSQQEENGKFYLKLPDVQYDMQIYDRWGNRIFAAQGMRGGDPGQSWQPSLSTITEGVYVYVITVYTEDREIIKTGSVTVIR
ncbi:MAG TPA: gliding motility-associated C-terminal domain-containing protein [Saprospiraceae bacterium]|nr:gliding motility-associated C-terminal domain-containing protein [Saprospiraceae bacterium]